MLILLQGTSGAGKSTLASRLSRQVELKSRFERDELTVISTDSVRHVLRNYVGQNEEPILFASTYECGKVLSADDAYSSLSDFERNITGYSLQCQKVHPYIQYIIGSHLE